MPQKRQRTRTFKQQPVGTKLAFVPLQRSYHDRIYRLKPGIKENPQIRWQLPDRIFFGHGACHILAGIFLEAAPLTGFHAERIIPGEGYAGNHIFVTDGVIAFDFRGYSCRTNLLLHHTSGWSKVSGPGWHCSLEVVDFDLLETKDLNARKMLGPDQYPKDPRPRARSFLDRFNHVASAMKPSGVLG
jgi:hypothetical protein